MPLTSSSPGSSQHPTDPAEDDLEVHHDRRPRRRAVLLGGGLAVLAGAVGVVALVRSGDDDVPPTSPTPSGAGEQADEVDVASFGAVGDGVTDDTAALQSAFDGLLPGQRLRLLDGATYPHSAVLRITVPDVAVVGFATLLATSEAASSLTVAADRVLLQDLVLAISGVTRRWDAYEQQRLRIDGHDGLRVVGVTVQGSAAAGVYVGGGASNFVLDRLRVSGTEADGIHMTQGAHDGRVLSPVLSGTGDDAVAVVSYQQDGEPCARITVSSPVVQGTTGGRGLSVVGGTDVTYEDVTVRDTAAAGIYVAVEGDPYRTAPVSGVRVLGGSVVGANNDADIDHGAVLVYAGNGDLTVSDVSFSGLRLVDTRRSASRQIGVLASRADALQDISFEDIDVTGGPSTVVGTDDPDQGFAVSGLVVDGVARSDEDGAAAPA